LKSGYFEASHSKKTLCARMERGVHADKQQNKERDS